MELQKTGLLPKLTSPEFDYNSTEEGDRELIAIEDGYRESEQSWLEVLMDLKKED
jgi:hypothetical protein